MTVKPVRWDQVAESDKIQNPATKAWHEVTATVLSKDGALVKVWVKGQAVALKPRPAAGVVDVQRGATGEAVDLFQVIFSGRTAPEH
jgi:hypothetical protein